MKYIYILLLLCISGCLSDHSTKKARVIYRIGFDYIELSFDESGYAQAKTGRGNSIDEDSFFAESTTDSVKFYIKNSSIFFKKLEELKEKKIERAKSYTRTQIYLNDSLYFDTEMYSSDFWDIYSNISNEIPDAFNPFKTDRFD
ncbi:hypothetical protein U0038_11170 [Sphingobacterium spiritivorum]|uniref:Uncharacterized protein n=1 Tax=Sphingobacterium spiritivorum ATCC 33861 TaxID=525373 RepID=D7VS06_SPHSI|nr:hypothetical protein [Sphingobacterium spiritivorum]EFK56557.1 hypothetical protein HMPREF0766_13760 [Sphingobacterium spiritivorum ATCC 33861]QQT35383.1 hypothetical protein I6J01_19220 [Sphingobacterium spiritivorum]WQD32069.1 hypothetical protein U0038_11170 [Sphingobacterium spiritivorum]SUJ05503.1 Uncharacterised protein [Sphingobacterium spiritivorum]